MKINCINNSTYKTNTLSTKTITISFKEQTKQTCCQTIVQVIII